MAAPAALSHRFLTPDWGGGEVLPSVIKPPEVSLEG
jgi:hypothetical protein